MERKRQWLNEPSEHANNHGPAEYTNVSKPLPRTGHVPLKVGAYIVLSGIAVCFLAILVRILVPLGMLIVVVGAAFWIVGLVKRTKYNRSVKEPLPYTAGEIVGIIGAVITAFGCIIGMFAIASETAGPIFGILMLIGVLVCVIGLVLHILIPRPQQGN